MNQRTPQYSKISQWLLAIFAGAIGIGFFPTVNAADKCANVKLPSDFAEGQCVWYVRKKVGVPVPWYPPDAKDWIVEARKSVHTAKGWRAEGNLKPEVGAIAVFKVGDYGHVAYIEDVGRDGSFTVSHCNWGGKKELSKTIKDPLLLACSGWTDARCINGVGPTRATVSAGGQLGNSATLLGIIYPPGLKVAAAPAPPLAPNPPTGNKGTGRKSVPQYAIRIFNVDVPAEASINGRVVARVNARGDTGPVPINNMLHSRDNKVRFKLGNESRPHTYHFVLLENGQVKWDKKCGKVDRTPCKEKLKNGEKSITLHP
ncbi:CHAP domain-containing protein [Sulfuritalea sp.]|uniref:CHAP domain-containing protein n=1 Tax=Sulfuritalea sp. TaxID=2480090 RepID=UPI001AD5C60D|nr:CHAP domain-containing protein [Sulfuritalea sp.]MBN8476752.1 CHAP domain-containing protein [Sulfuritalea sp.]